MTDADEETLHAAQGLYGIAHADLPGGKTQAIAQMQGVIREIIDSHALRSHLGFLALDQYVRDDKERQRLWDDDFSTALQGISVSNSGIALSSISHPRTPLWRRIWSWFFPPRLHDNALETIEIELPEGDEL